MTRRARLRTAHDDPETVAAAVRPDNTPELRTRVADGRVVTEVERDRTGGLATTVDDYLVNVRVAERVAAAARDTDAEPTDTTHDT
ncbi:MAG: KEOPS complex subunit Pcc1 [Haloferacaceae archaeon]